MDYEDFIDLLADNDPAEYATASEYASTLHDMAREEQGQDLSSEQLMEARQQWEDVHETEEDA